MINMLDGRGIHAFGESARQNVHFALFALTVTGLLLRLLFLGWKSVWLDEAFSYYASARGSAREENNNHD